MGSFQYKRICQAALLLGIIATVTSANTILTRDSMSRRKLDGDFEFADEEEAKSNRKEGKKTWILDPGSDLCQALKCKKKELCLLEDEFTAVCVSKKELHKSGDVIVPKSKIPKVESSKLDDDSKEYDEDEDDDSDYYADDDDDSNEDMFNSNSNKLDMKNSQATSSSGASSDPSSSNNNNYKSCTSCPVVKPTFLCGSDNRTYSSLCRLDYHNCIQNSQVTVACKGFCPCKGLDELAKKKQAEADRMSRFMLKYKKTVKLEQEQQQQQQQANNNNGKLNKLRQKFAKNSLSSGGSSSVNVMKPTNQNRLDSIGIFSSSSSNNNNNNNNEFASASGSPVASNSPGTNKDRYYTKYKDYSNKKVSSDKQRGFNEVVNTKSVLPRDCDSDALESMGNRLLDWFSVVMSDTHTEKRKLNRRRSNNQVPHFPENCKAEVQWMFQHLNSDDDNQLSLQELFDLENDRNEKCIKPFIDRCDGDKNGEISVDEWCKCFTKKSDRPCTAVRRKTGNGLLEQQQMYVIKGKPSCGSFSTRDDVDDEDDADVEGSGSDGPLEI